MSNMPAPLVPADIDLAGYEYLPLDVVRLRDSKIVDEVSGDAFRAAILLWCAAWHQIPAGSLPDDDKQLAKFAGYGRIVKVWQKIRNDALYGFIKCSDGRFYHPVLCEKAMIAWESRKSLSSRGKAGASKRWKDHKAEPSKSDGQSNATANEKNGKGSKVKGSKVKGREVKGREVNTAVVVPLQRPSEAQAAFQTYNEAAERNGWARADMLTEKRRKSLTARLRECGGLDGWRAALAKAEASDFCMGRTEPSPGRKKFRVDLDFLISQEKFVRLMEGFYDNRGVGRRQGVHQDTADSLGSWLAQQEAKNVQ